MEPASQDRMTDQPVTSPNQITCTRCNQVHTMAEVIHEEQKRHDLIEVYMQCPDCGQRLHVYFDSPDLRRRRARLQEVLVRYQGARTQANWQAYRAQRDGYRRAFDAWNQRWRRKFKMYAEAET